MLPSGCIIGLELTQQVTSVDDLGEDRHNVVLGTVHWQASHLRVCLQVQKLGKFPNTFAKLNLGTQLFIVDGVSLQVLLNASQSDSHAHT